MELSKCFGCMEDFRGYPCPSCGYDPGKDKHMEYALPPETILAGKYLVGRVLGQGGFGITYIGWDIALERKVAIKEYYPSGQVSRNPGTRILTWYSSEQSLHARQDGMQMFLKEARKMVKADGIPGVVRVIDLFQENNTAYIAMEFVEGETLKERLRREGPMDWETAKRIFRPVISSMEQVHKFGLIHRDLSPDNIMLLPDGSVKILDLGAAKDLSINSGASSMQVAKSGFSPLEQYIQRGGSGPWTDVYSMAATIYYTLTGKLLPSAVERLEKDTISWDFPVFNRLPAQAREALKKALAVQVKDRTQTMEALEKGLFAEPAKPQPPKPEPEKKTPAAPGTDAKNTKKPKIKRRWLVAIAAVLAMAFGMEFGRWYAGLVGTGTTKNDQTTTVNETQAAILQDTQAAILQETQETMVPTTPANVSDALYGYYEDAHHLYGFSLKEGGTCNWYVVGEGVNRAGTYTIDGGQITMNFPDLTSPVTATREYGKLIVSCWAFEDRPFTKTGNDPEENVENEEVATTTASSNYISEVYGEWQDFVLDSQHKDASGIVFTQALKGCKKITVHMEVSMNSGAKVKKWQLWGRVNGKFKKLEQIDLPGGNGSATKTIEFDPAVTLDAIAITPTINGGYSWTEWLWATDAWLED